MAQDAFKRLLQELDEHEQSVREQEEALEAGQTILEAAQHRRDVLKQAVDVLREGGLLDPDIPALPAPSGKPEEGVKREEPPKPATPRKPAGKASGGYRPSAVKCAPGFVRHEWKQGGRQAPDGYQMCERDGCGARRKGSKSGGDKHVLPPAQSSGQLRSSSAPWRERAKQEPTERREPPKELVSKMLGEGEKPTPAPAPDGDAEPTRKLHPKQPRNGDATCPACKKYPLEPRPAGKPRYCPSPDCDWREWTEAAA